jgi:hypothetical protein
MTERVHFGPAIGPDGLGQATACGQNVANRWTVLKLDPKAVTCKRCLKTYEVRAITTPIQRGPSSGGGE